MKIKEIKNQSRRDFKAVFQCGHCGHEHEAFGYDDDNFHCNVIPAMVCPACGKKEGDEYRPMGTKYAADDVV